MHQPHQGIAHALNHLVNQAQCQLAELVASPFQVDSARRSACLRSYLLTLLDLNQALLTRFVEQGIGADLSDLSPSGIRWQDVIPPRRGRMHALSLPDITTMLPHLSFVSDSSMKSKLPLLHTLSKLLPSRCLFRGFQDSLCREFETSPNSVTFVTQCVAASLAGTIPSPNRVTTAPFFGHIVEIDMAFGTCTQADIIALVKRAPRVVFQALKETICYYIRFDAPLRDVLCDVYDGWKQFEHDVHLVSESVRASYGSFEDTSWSKTLRECEDRLHRQSGGASYVKKLQKRSFMNSWLVQCQKVLTSRDFGPAEQRNVGLDVMSLIAQLVAQLSSFQTWTAQSHLLAAAGIESETVVSLCQLAEKFGSGEVSANSLGQALSKMSNQTLALASLVYGMIEDASHIESVPVTTDMAKQQRYAMYCRLGHPIDQPLPAASGVVYVCWQCGRDGRKWRCPEERTDELYGIGPHDVFHSADGTICCNKKSNGGFCGGSRVGSLCLLGRWVMFYGRWYTLCPLCAAPCRFDMRRAKETGGFSCGRCMNEGERLRMTHRKGAGVGLAAPWPRDIDPMSQTTSCANCAQKRTLSDDSWREMFVGNDRDPTISERLVLCLGCAYVKDSKWGVSAFMLGTTRGGLLTHIQKSKQRRYNSN